MLEGLEASEVMFNTISLNEVTNRIDSEFFLKKYLCNNKSIKKYQNGFSTLNKYIKRMSGGATPLGAEYELEGIPFLRVQNIMQNYFNLSDVVYITKEQDNEIKRSRLKENDVLLTITGVSYGKSAVVPNELVDANINQHSVKIELQNDLTPFFLSTFLNSKFGKLQSDKNVVGVTRPALDYESIRNFLIPNVSKSFQLQIEETVKSAHAKLEQSKGLYAEAENLLLEELGLKDWQPTNESVSIKTFSESQQAGRLDAEYYQPKYEEIEKKIKSYKCGFDIVSSFFTQNKTTCAFNEQAYNYIEIGDIDIGAGKVAYNLIPTDELPANAKIIVNKGDLLVSKVRPYRGAVAIVDFDEKDVIASGAFTILREKQGIKKEVLQVLLRTSIYKDWLLKWNVGSSYPVIKDEDILDLIIPKIVEDVQAKIAAKIQQSFALKAESKRLLAEAKAAVEREIETN